VFRLRIGPTVVQGLLAYWQTPCTVLCNTVLCNTVLCNTVLCNEEEVLPGTVVLRKSGLGH
jgi:hypothetical protein